METLDCKHCPLHWTKRPIFTLFPLWSEKFDKIVFSNQENTIFEIQKQISTPNLVILFARGLNFEIKLPESKWLQNVFLEAFANQWFDFFLLLVAVQTHLPGMLCISEWKSSHWTYWSTNPLTLIPKKIAMSKFSLMVLCELT